MTACTIVDLLARRHTDDLFVPECKYGPTIAAEGAVRRIDAVAIVRSWIRPTAVGYEVKVARADFLRDDKAHEYRDVLNAFSFVCPHGLIQPDEVGDGVGLLWVTKTGNRLLTKKKAVHVERDLDPALMQYVLFSRAVIATPDRTASRREVWRKWVDGRRTDRTLGYLVAGRLGEKMRALTDENRALRERIAGYDGFREQLREAGWDDDGAPSRWSMGHKIETLRSLIPDGVQRDLRASARALAELVEQLDVLEREAQES